MLWILCVVLRLFTPYVNYHVISRAAAFQADSVCNIVLHCSHPAVIMKAVTC